MSGQVTLFSLFASIALISGVMVIRARNPVHSVLFLIVVFCSSSGLLMLLGLDFFAMIFLVVYVGAIAVLFLFVVMMLNIKLAEIHDNVLRYLPVGGLLGFLFLCEILVVVDNDLIALVNPTWPILLATQSGLTFTQQIYLVSIFLQEILGALFNGHVNISLGVIFNEFITDISTPLRVCVETTNLGAYLAQDSLESASGFNSVNLPIAYTEWTNQLQVITNIEAVGQLVYTYYVLYFFLAGLILLVAMIGAIVLTMHKGTPVKRQDLFVQNARSFSDTVQKLRLT